MSVQVSAAPSARPDPARRVVRLGPQHWAEVVALVDEQPLVNCILSARLAQLGTLEPRALGGIMLGVRDDAGGLRAALFAGGNVLPVGGDPSDWLALAIHLAGTRRRASSILGAGPAVRALWALLAPTWGPARAERRSQPLLVLDRSATVLGGVGGDARVRPIRADELDRYVPASAAMFTEELGVSPYRAAGVEDYRRRVAALVAEGRAFGIVDAQGVLFKADIGTVSRQTAQVQGVWVRPDDRGRGLAAAALAPVLRHALTLAPTVSLYVNDFNRPARRVYDRLGMRPAGELATILF
jgi:uncharacterized protein